MSTLSSPTPAGSAASGAKLKLIDTDVHHAPDHKEVLKRMPKALAKRGWQMPSGSGFSNPHSVNRPDARPPGGGSPGSDSDHMLEHHFDRYGIDLGILQPGGTLGIGTSADYRYAAAVATAYNDYMLDTWLAHDPRFRASLFVAGQWPEAAAKEVRRVGGEAGFVQVIMASATLIPLGHVNYWPIYEAAEEMGLPVAVHPGTEGRGISNPPSPAGWPSSYFEWHNDLSQNYMGQINSLVCEGVFQQFPGLTFVAIEGGYGWLPHLMWRMDKNWKALRELTPWLTDPPSEVIRRHVRVTTQPVEEPETAEQFRQLLTMCHADEVLMFSSDYPHWDGDDPVEAFPKLDPDLHERIMWKTAAELYKFGAGDA